MRCSRPVSLLSIAAAVRSPLRIWSWNSSMSAPEGATVFGSNEGPTPPRKEKAHLVRSLNACVTRIGLVSPLTGDGMVGGFGLT
jgi:hypothetical protein